MYSKIPRRKIGVESYHGFGDCLFNVPLIRELSRKYNTKIGVAVKRACKDAFYNIPWIDEIIECDNMWDGINKMKVLGYETTYQITQNVKFFEFRESDPNHSLIETPLLTGLQIGLERFNNKPIYIPTENEISKTDNMASSRPTIAIESVFNSIQSWADAKAFEAIVNKFKDTNRILWLSNNNAPKIPSVDDLLRFNRRECIMCLRAAEIFFSVGSGFFCSSLALGREYQPKKIVCLWIDDMYKYEKELQKKNWHNDITWVHNHEELLQVLNNI
jgi:hypothetical protein